MALPISSLHRNLISRKGFRFFLLGNQIRSQCIEERHARNYSSSETERTRVQIKELEDGIFNVRLNRPEKLNSLDMPMFESIAQSAAKLREEKSLRAIIISGEGRAFCTGLDVKSIMTNGNPFKSLERLLERPSGYGREQNSQCDGNVFLGNLAQDVSYLWRDIPVPVIAVLHGMCFGGGLQIALGADFRFATPDCQISIMESKWGLIPDMSGSITLRELVRMDVAKELTMTGKIVSGEEASSLGLVTRCVSDPMEEALKVAKEIKNRSPDAVAATKTLFHQTWSADEQSCLEIETKLQRKLLASWNQLGASARNFGLNIPFTKRTNFEDKND